MKRAVGAVLICAAALPAHRDLVRAPLRAPLRRGDQPRGCIVDGGIRIGEPSLLRLPPCCSTLESGLYRATHLLSGEAGGAGRRQPEPTMIVQGNGKAADVLPVIGGRLVVAGFGLGIVAGAMGLAWLCIGRRAPTLIGRRSRSQDHRSPPTTAGLSPLTPRQLLRHGGAVRVIAHPPRRPDLAVFSRGRSGRPSRVDEVQRRLRPLPAARGSRCPVRRDALRHRGLYVALGAACVGFAAATPSILFDPGSVIGGLRAELAHYRTGHPGSEGNPLGYYARRLWQQEGAVVLLAPVSLARCRFNPGPDRGHLPDRLFAPDVRYPVRSSETWSRLSGRSTCLSPWGS